MRCVVGRQSSKDEVCLYRVRLVEDRVQSAATVAISAPLAQESVVTEFRLKEQ